MMIGYVLGGLVLLAVLWAVFGRRQREARATAPPPPVQQRRAVRSGSEIDTGAKTGVDAADRDAVTGAASGADGPPVPDELAQFTLRLRADIDASVSAAVAHICSSMPEPHPVQMRLASGLDEPEDLVQVVSTDAGLTADILRTVNSASFALAEPMSSVRHAITFLGINIVKGIVLRAATTPQNTAPLSAVQEAALAAVWQSSCVASAVVQLLAQELGRAGVSVLATRALFFNIGDVALLHSHPDAPSWYRDDLSLVQRLDAQQAACGANASIVGAMLARRWGLPNDIAIATEQAYLPLVNPPEQMPLRGEALTECVLLYLAGLIGDRAAYRQLRDVGELGIDPAMGSEFHYLPQHLECAGLAALPGLLESPALRRKVNRILAAFQGPT